jgi:hypothetical protein
MADHVSTPHAEDLVSVGTRVSWGAIAGGALVAFAIYFMLTILGAAVGLTVSDRVKPTSLQTAAVAWGILTLSAALFVGGLMTSLFTVGENKVEAVFYGVIMWAFLLGLLIVLGAVGIQSGFKGMVALTNFDPSMPVTSWEGGAKEAGVPAEVIADWRRKTGAADKLTGKAEEPGDHKEMMQAATRVAWYTFGGIWISMLAAALGAWLGAGPTFRIVAVRGSRVT